MYKENITDKMTSRKNQKEFWNLLGKLSGKKVDTSMYVSHNSLHSHFKSLLNTSKCNDFPPVSKEHGPLDYTITPEELKKAATCLKVVLS